MRILLYGSYPIAMNTKKDNKIKSNWNVKPQIKKAVKEIAKIKSEHDGKAISESSMLEVLLVDALAKYQRRFQ